MERTIWQLIRESRKIEAFGRISGRDKGQRKIARNIRQFLLSSQISEILHNPYQAIDRLVMLEALKSQMRTLNPRYWYPLDESDKLDLKNDSLDEAVYKSSALLSRHMVENDLIIEFQDTGISDQKVYSTNFGNMIEIERIRSSLLEHFTKLQHLAKSDVPYDSKGITIKIVVKDLEKSSSFEHYIEFPNKLQAYIRSENFKKAKTDDLERVITQYSKLNRTRKNIVKMVLEGQLLALYHWRGGESRIAEDFLQDIALMGTDKNKEIAPAVSYFSERLKEYEDVVRYLPDLHELKFLTAAVIAKPYLVLENNKNSVEGDLYRYPGLMEEIISGKRVYGSNPADFRMSELYRDVMMRIFCERLELENAQANYLSKKWKFESLL
jgi:hypothetical protein